MRSCRSKQQRPQRLSSYPGPSPMNFNPGTMVRQTNDRPPSYGPNVPAALVAAVPRRSSRSQHSQHSRSGSVPLQGQHRSSRSSGANGTPGHRPSGSAQSALSIGSGSRYSQRSSEHGSQHGSGHYAPQFPIGPIGNNRADWVDETLYSGPSPSGRR